MPHRIAAGVAFTALLLAPWPGSPAFGSTTSTPKGGASPSWTVYHGDPTGAGVATGISSVNVTSPAWTSPDLDGSLYGEPLAANGRVFVATENDTVYALSGTKGTIDWSTHFATPVPSASLPCGDITPTVGVTGTPVLDVARDELFVVADEMIGGTPAHQLVGLSVTTGKIELNQNVDPADSSPAALLQRTGLTLDAGHVVFGYGGNFGDCSTYHGWVVSVPETGGTPTTYSVDSAPGESQGAVWMGGAAPVVDGNGNIWVTSGNGSVTSAGHAYDDSDAVLELSPALTLEQYFAPSSWASDNARDLDFSTGVALLGDGQAIAASKSRTVFLLNASSLGGVGGQLAELADACSTVIDGGFAAVGSIVYLPCRSGPIAVQASDSPAGLRLLWSSSAGGGPPIVAGGLLWTIGSDGVLYGLDPSSGAVKQQASIGVPANHFPTPSVGANLLLAPSSNRVVAFSAPTSAPSASTSTSTSTTGQRATTTSSLPTGRRAGTDPWVIVAATLGGVAVLAVVALLFRRRRRSSGS
jgi:polyvinyl alcohol dehydrogenase (cytochrome)